MKKLMLLLIVLTICVPAYADLLVYQVGIDARGIVHSGEASYFGGENLHAFVVVDIDFEATGGPAIISSSLIFYGKPDGKVQVTLQDVINDFFTDAISPKGYATGVSVDTAALGHAYLTGKSKATSIGVAVKRIIPANTNRSCADRRRRFQR